MKWLECLPASSWIKNVRNAGEAFIKRIRTSVTNLKPFLVKYLGWGLLYMGMPFTKIGNWFWKRHRDVLDWNKK